MNYRTIYVIAVLLIIITSFLVVSNMFAVFAPASLISSDGSGSSLLFLSAVIAPVLGVLLTALGIISCITGLILKRSRTPVMYFTIKLIFIINLLELLWWIYAGQHTKLNFLG